MKTKILVALFSTLVASSANADITSSLSGPAEINWYETATFTANVSSTTDGYDGASLDGLSYRFYAGDGRSWGGSLGSGVVESASLGYIWEGSPRSFAFVASFQYLVPGTYAPSFSITKQTTEFDTDYVPVAYEEINGYWHQVSVPYSCGFLNLSTCYEYRDEYVVKNKWINAGSGVWHDFSYNRFADSTASTTLVVGIPEPETYAMMLAGLGFLGVMARRRRKKTNA